MERTNWIPIKVGLWCAVYANVRATCTRRTMRTNCLDSRVRDELHHLRSIRCWSLQKPISFACRSFAMTMIYSSSSIPFRFVFFYSSFRRWSLSLRQKSRTNQTIKWNKKIEKQKNRMRWMAHAEPKNVLAATSGDDRTGRMRRRFCFRVSNVVSPFHHKIFMTKDRMSGEIALPIAVCVCCWVSVEARARTGQTAARERDGMKIDSIYLGFIPRRRLVAVVAAAAFLTLDYTINCHLHIVIDFRQRQRRRKHSINWNRWNEHRVSIYVVCALRRLPEPGPGYSRRTFALI